MVLKFLKRKTASLKKLLELEQPPPSGSNKKREGWFDGISQIIEDILKEEAARFGTHKVHIISLTDFRTALGAQWQRLSSKVMLIGENVIQRHIGLGHLYNRQGEDAFLLLFRNIPSPEASPAGHSDRQRTGPSAGKSGLQRPLGTASSRRGRCGPAFDQGRNHRHDGAGHGGRRGRNGRTGPAGQRRAGFRPGHRRESPSPASGPLPQPSCPMFPPPVKRPGETLLIQNKNPPNNRWNQRPTSTPAKPLPPTRSPLPNQPPPNGNP